MNVQLVVCLALFTTACQFEGASSQPESNLETGVDLELGEPSTASVIVTDQSGAPVPELDIDPTWAEVTLRTESSSLALDHFALGLRDIIIPEREGDGTIPLHLTEVSIVLSAPVGQSNPPTLLDALFVADLELRWSLQGSDGAIQALPVQRIGLVEINAQVDLETDTVISRLTAALPGEILDFGELAISDLSMDLTAIER